MTSGKWIACLFGLACLLPAQDSNIRQKEDDDPRARQEWFYGQRAWPRNAIPPGARLNAIRQIQRIDAAARARRANLSPAAAVGFNPAITNDAANWTMIGPQPTDAGSTYVTAGRVSAIAIDPRDNNVVYIGAAEGGVWKTTDGGVNWKPLTDNQPSLATGSIAIDPNNPDTIYVGTGEENFSADSYYGAGILKSTDAGATWRNIVGPFLRDRIGSIIVQPSNSQVVICASASGVWRSTDGGETWTPVLSGAAAITVAFDPSNDTTVYATLGDIRGNSRNGLYRSVNGGVTWQGLAGAAPAALPTANVGRMELAVSKAAPATMFVQISDSSTANFGALLGIYKTTDAGATWNKMPISASFISQVGAQFWYYNTIRVSPVNPNIVYAGGLQLFRTLDGGNTWSIAAQVGPNNVVLHVDHHALAFTPDGGKLYIGNDGGMYSTTDVGAARINWTSLNNTLAITQFYPGMTLDPANPLKAVAGAQDNGTQRFDGDRNWSNVTCGDGGFAAIDPSVPGLAYAACQRIEILRTAALDGSAAWMLAQYGLDETDATQFISPLILDGANPQTLYFGTYRMWQSTDGGGKWNAISPDLTGGNKGTIKTIEVAASDSKTVYAGTNNSKVQMTNDAQRGAASRWTDRSAGLPPRTITRIAVDPLNAAAAYVTFSGFPATFGTVPDSGGHVFRTTDSGATWTDISGNLPVIPVNDIVVDPDIPRTLYIGTDAGVMVTNDGGATWSSLGNGLPVVVVQSLVLHRGSRVLRAATHGRSVWDILVPAGAASVQPAIQSVTPSVLDAGSGAATLRLTGANFRAGTSIRWNGQDRATTFVDAAHVTVQLPAADVAAVGRGTLTAFDTSAGLSNSLSVPVGPAPKFVAEGFVSAANPLGGSVLAQRAIGSIYGTNLSGATVVADRGAPLPAMLGGTTLTIGGNIVPLFFVSPGQINFQVPFLSVTGPTAVPLTITQGTLSSTVTVRIQPAAPALFTTNSQGTGQGSILIAGTASVAAPVGAFPGSRPVRAGEFLSIYCTGLGDVTNRPALGSASPSTTLSRTLTAPVVTIGGVPATVSFSGLAPGFVGLYQVNVQVPAGVAPGADVPVVLTLAGAAANTVTVAVE
ncbi:MAG: glycosyl hydrolase [Candidatus Solibacter sp.]|nr:glycosyl hydrolase [Candidatus Solibacter sp.]